MSAFAQLPGLFTPRHYGWLALIYAAVTLFASLLPLHYRPLPFGEALRLFAAVCHRPITFDSPADWLTNVVLFIPLGYLLTATLAVDRPRVRLFVAAAVVAGCAFFSAATEFSQLFFPPRICSLDDVVAETLGAILGALAWVIVGQRLTGWARRDHVGLGGGVFPVELLPCCVLALTVLQLLPLDLSIHPAELYHKYRAGRIRLAFFMPWPGADVVAIREFTNISLFVPIGVLLAGLNPGRWGEWTHWRRVFAVALLLVASIKFLQLFELKSDSFPVDVITYGLAIVLGWALGVALRRNEPSWPVRARVGLCAWLAVILFLNWHPFDFAADVGMAARRLAGVSLIPLLDYWQSNYVNALQQFVSRLALYLPVGLMLPAALGREPSRPTAIVVLLMVAMWAAMVEVGQAFVPSRYPSLTDVLVETLGAWFGYQCARRLRTASCFPARSASDG